MDCPTQNAYWLDQQDRIVEVSAEWDAFAEANEGLCVAALVKGQSLWDHIADSPTLRWMEALVAQARLAGELTQEYRCDSPNRKRFMRMSIRCLSDDRLEVRHELLREEVLDPPVVVEPATTDYEGSVHRCSCCNRLQFSNAWLEPDYAASEGFVPAGHPLMIVYTVCPACTTALDSVDSLKLA